jgi:hypothetical protein
MGVCGGVYEVGHSACENVCWRSVPPRRRRFRGRRGRRATTTRRARGLIARAMRFFLYFFIDLAPPRASTSRGRASRAVA